MAGYDVRGVSVGVLLYVLAVVLFVLAAFGVDGLGLSSVEVAFLGLASFAAAHIVP